MCRWLLCNYITYMNPSVLLAVFNLFHASTQCTENEACKIKSFFEARHPFRWVSFSANQKWPNLQEPKSLYRLHSILYRAAFESNHNCAVAKLNVWGGGGGGLADKSLVRSISLCRRTESIVSLERVVYSCAEFHVFSCYISWKESCQATGAISTTSRRELSPFFFSTRQGSEGNLHHSDWNIRETCTIVCQRQILGGPV